MSQLGQPGKRRAVCSSCSPLRSPSMSWQFTAHVLSVPWWSFSSPCLGSDCFWMEYQQQTQPLPTHLLLLLSCVLWCLPAVSHTQNLYFWPQEISHFVLCIISRVLQPFVCLLLAWSGVRGRQSRASFHLEQHPVCINTVVKPFRLLAFAQNSSLHM